MQRYRYEIRLTAPVKEIKPETRVNEASGREYRIAITDGVMSKDKYIKPMAIVLDADEVDKFGEKAFIGKPVEYTARVEEDTQE